MSKVKKKVKKKIHYRAVMYYMNIDDPEKNFYTKWTLSRPEANSNIDHTEYDLEWNNTWHLEESMIDINSPEYSELLKAPKK